MGYKAKVKKKSFDVIIRTAEEKIEGQVYIIPDTRLLDMVNKKEEHFVAVTDAKVYSVFTGKLLFQAHFLALNKKQIVFIAEGYSLPPEG